jgi:hypothetical protein
VSDPAITAMRPLAAMPEAARASIRGVLVDVDETLTTRTGRPAGWCDHIARMWPVAAVVGENGAFWMRYDHDARRLESRYVADEATRRANRARLSAIGESILRAVPGCALASDQLYREADLAIDFREDVPELPGAAVDRIVALMEA